MHLTHFFLKNNLARQVPSEKAFSYSMNKVK
jgi:hypothetical protein